MASDGTSSQIDLSLTFQIWRKRNALKKYDAKNIGFASHVIISYISQLV